MKKINKKIESINELIEKYNKVETDYLWIGYTYKRLSTYKTFSPEVLINWGLKVLEAKVDFSLLTKAIDLIEKKLSHYDSFTNPYAFHGDLKNLWLHLIKKATRSYNVKIDTKTSCRPIKRYFTYFNEEIPSSYFELLEINKKNIKPLAYKANWKKMIPLSLGIREQKKVNLDNLDNLDA